MSTQQYYDQTASAYDSQRRTLYFRIYDHITWKFTEPYVPKNRDALVLDAAGGTGEWSIPIAKTGSRVVLVDLSGGMLEVARRKVLEQGLDDRVKTVQGDVASLDYPDETFDFVFCDHALGFFSDAPKTIAELTRVLKTGSPIVISAQNRYPLALSLFSQFIEEGTKILKGEEPFMMRGLVPVHTFFPDEFRHILEKNGILPSKLVGKGILLTPLVLPMEKFYTDKYEQDFYDRLLKLELELCERKDALSLAGHIQAVGVKQK